MSTVEYHRWDADDRVSAEWHAVLTAARRDGVSFTVTDGHRTFAEQADRFAVFQRDGPSAAAPTTTTAASATAPSVLVRHERRPTRVYVPTVRNVPWR